MYNWAYHYKSIKEKQRHKLEIIESEIKRLKRNKSEIIFEIETIDEMAKRRYKQTKNPQN